MNEHAPRRTEYALGGAEQYLRAVLEAEPECVKVVAADCTLLDMNAAGLAMIEAESLDEVRCKSVCSLIAPPYRKAFAEFISRVSRGRSETMEFEVVGLKGTRRWMESHAVAFPVEDDTRRRVLSITRDITDRKQAQEALHQNERRFRAMIEHSSDGIILSNPTTGMTVYASSSVERVLGYTPEEFVGQMRWDVVHPDYLQSVKAQWAEVLEKPGKVITGRFRVRHKDGTWRWVERTLTNLLHEPNVQAVVSNFHDITERKRAGDALCESERRLRAILDGALDAVVDMDERGVITNWNPRAEVLFGWSAGEAIGRNLAETIIPPQYRTRHQEGLKHFLATGKGPVINRRVEFTALRREGTELPIELTINAFKEDRSYRFTAFIADITERKQAETIRRQFIQKIIHAQEEERRRLAHELHDETGQTLTALLRGLRQSERIPTLDATRAHIGELRNLTLHAIEEIKRLVTGLRPRVLDDLGLVEALKRHLEDFGRCHDLNVDFQASGLADRRLPDTVETAFYRIAQEALTNIAKHARARRASLLLQGTRSEVRLIVEDDGCGFEKDVVLATDQAGTQLGIDSMRKRAAMLDGSFTIETAPDRGTTLYVRIPIPGVT